MSKSRPENGDSNNSKKNSDNSSKPNTLNLIELKKKDINSLIKIAREYDIENANSMRGQELLFAFAGPDETQRDNLRSRSFGSPSGRVWIS